MCVVMARKLTADDFIGVRNEKTNEIWTDLCQGEVNLLDACSKLPRYGKKCNCNEDTVTYKFSVTENARARTRERCLECGGYAIFEEPEFKGEKFVVRVIGENRITIPEVYAKTQKLQKGDMVRVRIERVK